MTDEQRSQTGWIGVQESVVILARALSSTEGDSKMSRVLYLLLLLAPIFPACDSSREATRPIPVEPEIDFAGDVPLLPNVTPVVIMKGSDHEMGYQYARQITQIFGRWLLEHEIVHPELSDEQINVLKSYHLYIEKHTPEMIDFFKGMVAGAEEDGISLSYEEVVAQFTDPLVRKIEKIDYPEGMESQQLPPNEGKCSGFAAWGTATQDGKMIASGSSDGRDYMSVIMLFFPDDGNRFIWWPYEAMGRYLRSGGHPGLNEKGLIYVHHGLTQGPPDERYGIYSTLAVLHTLRYANTAEEAVDMQLSYETVGGCGGFWADGDGNALVIERREPPLIRKPGDLDEVDFLYATNTSLSEEVCKQGQTFIPRAGCVDKEKDKYWGDRNLQYWHMLTHYRGHIDFDFAKMTWRYPGEPLPIDYGPDDWDKKANAHYTEHDRAGWAYAVGRDTNSHIGIVIPDEMLYYACIHYASQTTNTGSPKSMHGQPYVPYATRTFSQLKLEESPEKVAKAAQYQAEIDLFTANRELRKLSYGDAAYAPLDEIYNKALIEWTKGEYIVGPDYGKVNWADEDEAVFHWAKATRAFTRCQSLARQVYNALVPPATQPEDLGLSPFKSFRR
jgi:hypothetical protein